MKLEYFPSLLLLLTTSFLLAACSTTSIKHYVAGNQLPLCNEENPAEKLVVYWGTAWRGNQKEVVRRSVIAEEYIEVFFRSNDCFDTLEISKIVNGKDVLLVTDSEIINRAVSKGADRAYVIRLEELGPNLMLYLSPILWQTQNEVLLRLRSINVGMGSLEADITAHWFRGGPFTIHGANSLPIDLYGVLASIFYGEEGALRQNRAGIQ